MTFEEIVLKAAVNTSRVVGVVVNGLTVNVRYRSGSGKTEQVASLLFDSAGKCTAIRNIFRSANVPKILADNIEELWRNNG